MTTIDVEGEEIEPTTAALEVARMPAGALTRPVASVEQTRQAFEEYQKLRNTIITREDVTNIQGKEFVNKSGWRKLAVIMGVSSEIVVRDYQRDDLGRITSAEVVVRAIAPNGRSIDGLGLCDFHERCCPRAFSAEAVCKNNARGHHHCPPGCDGFNHFSKPQHDIPATASTRALNRACADLFGFGEVSAEEVTDREEPAERADIDAIVAGLNALTPEGGHRTITKQKFAERFGMPDELKKGQLEQARKFVRAAGGNLDPAPPPAPPAGVDPSTGEVGAAPNAPEAACSCDPSDAPFVNPDCPVHGSDNPDDPDPDVDNRGGQPDPPMVDSPSGPVEPSAVTEAPEAPTDEDLAEQAEAAKVRLQERLSEEVAALSTVELTDALLAAGLGVGGNPKIRRARLVDHRYQEAMTAEVI